MLKTEKTEYYKVKSGQSLESVAEYFSLSPYLLAEKNGLTSPPYAGQILRVPAERGNGYTVKEGDTKELLCGSAENYRRLNGTDAFYIGMRVRI